MKLIICLDNSKGYCFNKRRQSKDSVVRDNIISLVGNDTLWMNEYSFRQFEPDTQGRNIKVSNDFLNLCGPNDYCFVETNDITPYMGGVSEIIVYWWNRDYPSDKKFNVDFNEFKKIKTHTFAGKSHPEVIEEIYVK